MSSSQRLEFAACHSVTDSESLTRFAPPGDGRSQLSSCWVRSPACGCRFGSGPGRFWVGVCRPWSHSFRRPLQQQKDQHLEEVAGQLFLEGKKQRVVNIVTVAWLVTAGLRGGQILEASISTCSASHSLLPSAFAAPKASRQCEGVGITEGVQASQSALLHGPVHFLRCGSIHVKL